MTWQGLGDIINLFRRKVLRLEPVDPSWAPGMIARMQIPHTYCWYVYLKIVNADFDRRPEQVSQLDTKA